MIAFLTQLSAKTSGQHMTLHSKKITMPLAAVASATTVPQQKITVTGQVIDSLSQPLSGVSIKVKGTSLQTASAKDGFFRLEKVSVGATLVISSVGYEPKQRTAVADMGKIVLHTTTQAMQEVDVTVNTGFQKIDKRKFPGATVVLKMDDIKLDGVVDLSRSLEGRAAGVMVNNVSGTFGSAPRIQIRGVTSILGSNKPLWVVDGLVLDDIANVSNDQLTSGDPITLLSSAVAGINMSDVESLTILKDAAATALYGARAANGVVVITTKKGTTGKMRFTYNTNISTYLKPSYKNYDIMNSAEQMSVYAELFRKGHLNIYSMGYRNTTGPLGNLAELLDGDGTGQFAVENTPEAIDAYLKKYALNNTDWFDVLFKTPLLQDHSISISGGTERSQTYVSGNFYNDNGWTLGDKVNRYTVNARNTAKLSDRITTNFTVNGSTRFQRAPGSISRIFDPAYSGGYVRNYDINPFNYAMTTSRIARAYDDNGNFEYYRQNLAPFNIVNELNENRTNISLLDVRTTGNLEYKVSSKLKYLFQGSVRYSRTTQELEATENSNRAKAYRANDNVVVRDANSLLYKDPFDPLDVKRVVMPYGGIYNREEISLKSYDIRNEFTYADQWNDHDLMVFGGQQMTSTDQQTFVSNNFGYQYYLGGVPFIDPEIYTKTIQEGGSLYSLGNTSQRFSAFYIAPSYTFKNKYVLNASLRYEGTNRLGSYRAARWLPTWTVAASWNVTDEPFMKNISGINQLKLRSSYGLTATLGPSSASLLVYPNVWNNRPFLSERESNLYISELANYRLTWEKMHSFNIGFDLSVLDNRLQLVLDWFKKNNFDLLGPLISGGTSGSSSRTGNVATMKGNGIEFTLKGDIIRNENFKWSSTGTFSYYLGKVTDYKAISDNNVMIQAAGATVLGKPLNSLYSYQYLNLEPNSGRPVIRGLDGGPSINGVAYTSTNSANLVYNGTTIPPYTGGLENSFRYKNLSLNIFTTFQAGNKIRMAKIFQPNYGDISSLSRELLNRYQLPGDEKIPGVVPGIIDAVTLENNPRIGSGYRDYNASTERVADGSFVRLKSIRLGYQLPNQASKALGVNGLQAAISMQNALLLYSDKKLRGQDPEFYGSGGVSQPLQQQIVFTLKADF
ncbi:hypothetical protein BWD42_07745 [Sphingobacterium sp. CZ-UAM]|uniref:SusC/RagA family TonB-linked outer membrane protein n=1 Tax=Sphingobacterium sp. CZ-UAM TaxID=1933868 RepID=UPI0009D2AAA6|nr:SusC/RagA family TonB-linked outer membrane protein [Sphingobacterium sp. CZ-UAM]OOG19783.1 hypothetical protein BWD42_07745 [Sphingobacterium sp. CZ-UAM]